MVIYLVTNKVNGKQYVGQTIQSVEKRWIAHTIPSETHNVALKNAIRKYEKSAFTVEVIQECESKLEMDLAEMFYISLLNTKRPNGYNLTDGGEGTPGHSVSAQGRLRMRLSHLGKKQSQTAINNRSKALRHPHKVKKAICVRGHLRTPENVSSKTYGCKPCMIIRQRLRRLRTQERN